MTQRNYFKKLILYCKALNFHPDSLVQLYVAGCLFILFSFFNHMLIRMEARGVYKVMK